MSKGNKSKAQGTKEEKRQRDVLLSYGFKVDRLAEEGIYDKGDYVVRLTPDENAVGEAKHMAAMNIHEAVAKARAKAGDDLWSFLWWKRSKRKGENKNRSQVGKPIVCMSEQDFKNMLAWAQIGLESKNRADTHEGPVPPVSDLYKMSPTDVPFLNHPAVGTPEPPYTVMESKDRKEQ